MRDLSQPKFAEIDIDESPLIKCSNDSKRHIFGYLNCLEDINSVMLTCKQFSEIITSQEYWKVDRTRNLTENNPFGLF